MRAALLFLLALAIVAACSPPAPLPASVTVRDEGQDTVARMNRVRVDGLIEAGEWERADSALVFLPDGREVMVLRQRGPESIDFAFLGLGGNWARNIYPEILLDTSGASPAQFSRDSWWFRISPSPCVKRASVDGVCDVQLTGYEASSPPADRRDNLEVSITLSMLELSPTSTPNISLAIRFAEQPLIVDAIWPISAELRRPDSWALVDITR